MVSSAASVLGLNSGVNTSPPLLCCAPHVGVFSAEPSLTGVSTEFGVSPVLASDIRVSKLRMALEGVSMVTPWILFLEATGLRESEAGLWGLVRVT